MTKIEELEIEQALEAAYVKGIEVGQASAGWQAQVIERRLNDMKREHFQSIEKTEVEAIKTLSQLGQTFASLAEALARGLQSRRNQL